MAAANKPLTTEAIALTEKKMDMTLDAIIEMNKKKTNPKVNNNRRVSNKNQKPFTPAAGQGQGNNGKMRRFMDSRSALRQGALNQRRSNFQRNQFPIANEAARKAAAAPIRNNRPFNRNNNRMANWNNPRVAIPPVQRMVVGYAVGKKQSQQGRMPPKQRPQTLDSLFANLKEQRMRVQQNNTSQQSMGRQNMARHTGVVGTQTRRGRGRFGNYAN